MLWVLNKNFMKTTMYINGQAVGKGKWKLQSVLNYATKQNLTNVRAYSIYACASYAETSHLDLQSGKYNTGQSTDHLSRMGIN
jgi:hypothetical protein